MHAIARSVSRRTKALCTAWFTGNSSGAGGLSQELCSTAAAFSNRYLSIQPEDTVYGGPTAPSPKRVTLRTVQSKYKKQEPISMVTAYDYPSAVHVDNAGIDILLVGDSVAMVVHGHDTTLPITLDDMILHCKAVYRGARRCDLTGSSNACRPFLVGDLPFGCYEASPQEAVKNAVRMMKEGNMDAVKLEGGGKHRAASVRAVVESGIAVMGHVGLLPQSISVLGGFRPQGQSAASALQVMEDALALQQAGCFAIVLECLPPIVAEALTKELSIPTIGIGAGPHCSGQVLVYHDLLGMMQHPHHAKVTPKFCKQFGNVGEVVQLALQQYKAEVSNGEFPSQQHSPYKLSEAETADLLRNLHDQGYVNGSNAVEERCKDLPAVRDATANLLLDIKTPML